MQKINLFHHFVLRHSWFKNPAVWLAKSILAHISEFSQIWSLPKHTAIDIFFHYRPNWGKINNLIFLYIQRTLGLAYFPHFGGKIIIFEKSGSVMHNTMWSPNTKRSSTKN